MTQIGRMAGSNLTASAFNQLGFDLRVYGYCLQSPPNYNNERYIQTGCRVVDDSSPSQVGGYLALYTITYHMNRVNPRNDLVAMMTAL